MTTSATAVVSKTASHQFHSPSTVIGRFVARRTMRSAVLWAMAFGVFVASKSIGYASAYPTLAARTKVAISFANNTGLIALLGYPRHIEIVASGAAWNTMGAMVLIGSIWAFLLATKTFRGEEDAGRLELLLAGQTTARRAAINNLAGLGASLTVLYMVLAAAFIAVGRVHSVSFSTQSALFFGLAAVSSAAMFIAIGALASQLMPTRPRAASLSAGIFGVCFLLRAMADTTNLPWLLNFTPLGWVEKMQPLYHSQPIWLVPVACFTVAAAAASVWLAGRHDLGASTFADKDTAKPRMALLGSPLGMAIRLTRASSFSWLVAIAFLSTFFGLLSKTVTQAFSDSSGAQRAISRLSHINQVNSATVFLGIVFFIVMTVLMAYAASAVGKLRDDEAQGYLDNLLVQPVTRWQWLTGRVGLAAAVIVAAGLLASISVWLSTASQHLTLSLHTLLLAGLNTIVPAVLTLGIGIFALGILPRLTSLLAYSVVAWSFLIQLISSGLNLNHWLLDTSVFTHVALAPAVNPRWGTAVVLVSVAVVLALIGAWRFNNRDLETE